MASPGLLFLLLVSSSLLLSTMSQPSQSQLQEDAPKKLNKLKEVAKATGKFILKNIDQIRFAVTPFLSLIPVCQPLISAITIAALVGAAVVNNEFKNDPVLDALTAEFETLNFKIDKYHVEQKWEAWVSSAYHKPEKNIDVAWKSYETLVPSLLKARSEGEKSRLTQEIINACTKSTPATKTLHTYLQAKPPTFISNLGDMIAEHVQCHEKDLREYTVFISELIYKGNTMNQLCYKLKQIETEDIINKEAQIAYDAGSVMFHVHKSCIFNNDKYLKADVIELIDQTDKRQELAQKVRAFLDETYGRYDWMVVAFITKHSQHKVIETLNKHVLTGFTDVPRGKVTVAVAKQVKGTHTLTSQVSDVIGRCVPRSTLCYKVAKKLSECSLSVGSASVQQTYTAVHAFLRKAHESHSDMEELDEVYAAPVNSPYVYEGKCEKSPGVKNGKYAVMIKSDEEIRAIDPCLRMDCGGAGRGKCDRMPDTFVALCECEQPYYGQNCEHSLEDYKRYLQGKIDLEALSRGHRTGVVNYGRPTGRFDSSRRTGDVNYGRSAARFDSSRRTGDVNYGRSAGRLDSSRRTGDVNYGRSAARLDSSSRTGDVNYGRSAARLDSSSRTGDVNYGRSAARLDSSRRTGDVNYGRSAARLDSSSRTGDVNYGRSAARLDSSSRTGDVNYGRSAARLDSSSRTGDVNYGRSAARFDSSSRTGDVNYGRSAARFDSSRRTGDVNYGRSAARLDSSRRTGDVNYGRRTREVYSSRRTVVRTNRDYGKKDF